MAVWQFDTFRFDPASGELHGAGGVTRLQPQVAALLAALLERAGTVVTRGELQARLWPDTTVDFDEGLNFCVRQLRLALGDDAGAPKYVETLPRRGYRFVAPAAIVDQAEPRAERHAGSPRMIRRRWVWVAALGGAIAVGAALGGFYRAPLRRHASAATPVVLAVLPFAHDTADRMLSGYHRRLLGQVNADARTEHAWRLVTDSSAATHILSGSLVRQGYSVRIFVQLVRAADHRHIWADSIVDSYAFSGNSTLTADRIEKSVARLLETNLVDR